MVHDINKLLSLTLELEGLLLMLRERGDMAPQEVDSLIVSKISNLNSLISTDKSETEGIYRPEDRGEFASENTQPTSVCTPEKNINEPEEVSQSQENASAAPDENKSISEAHSVDIRKSLTLNDKFLFRRELFNGDEGLFSETLSLLGSMTDINDIKDYLYNDLCFDPNDPNVIRFIEIIQSVITK